jgi:hypothetical protein
MQDLLQEMERTNASPLFPLMRLQTSYGASPEGTVYSELVLEGERRREAVRYCDDLDPVIKKLEATALEIYRRVLGELPADLKKVCPRESPWGGTVRGFCDIHNSPLLGAHTPYDLWVRSHGCDLGRSIAHTLLDAHGASQVFERFLTSDDWDRELTPTELLRKCLAPLMVTDWHPCVAHVTDGVRFELDDRFQRWLDIEFRRNPGILSPTSVVEGGRGDALWEYLPKTNVRVPAGKHEAVGYGTWVDGMGITFGLFENTTPIHVLGVEFLCGKPGAQEPAVMVRDQDLKAALAHRGIGVPVGGVHVVSSESPDSLLQQAVNSALEDLEESSTVSGEVFAVIPLG